MSWPINDVLAAAAALVIAIGFGVIVVNGIRHSNDWIKRNNDNRAGSDLSP